MNKIETFIFVGRSGSGKGTQINLLKEYVAQKKPEVEAYVFVMGDIFRSLMKKEGYIQNFINEKISRGLLVPDLIANNLFIYDLVTNFSPEQHLYIDGIPRSIPQAEAVIDIFKFYNRLNPIILDIKVSKKEVEKRMLMRGRSDDNGEAITARHSFYEKKVVPAIEFLKEKSGFTYIEIDGEKTTKEVHFDIIKSLNI